MSNYSRTTVFCQARSSREGIRPPVLLDREDERAKEMETNSNGRKGIVTSKANNVRFSSLITSCNKMCMVFKRLCSSQVPSKTPMTASVIASSPVSALSKQSSSRKGDNSVAKPKCVNSICNLEFVIVFVQTQWLYVGLLVLEMRAVRRFPFSFPFSQLDSPLNLQ